MRLLRTLLQAILAVLLVSFLIWSTLAVRRILSTPPPGPAGITPPGTWTYKFDFDGTERSYVLHVPSGLDPGSPVPLLMELHGGGGRSDNIDQLTGFYAIADRDGFIVAAPSGLNRAWNDGREEKGRATGDADDVGFLSAVIDQVEAQAAIDPGRVYATGISNGAFMSGRLACQLSDRIAAVAQVAGTAAVSLAESCDPGRPVPILQIHGTSDGLVPYEGGTVVPQLGGRGEVVSVDDWAAAWIARNGDDPTPQVTALGKDTTVRTWQGATPRSDVVFYRVEGGGHTWPGGWQYLPPFLVGSTTRTFSASEVIWSFLSAHTLY